MITTRMKDLKEASEAAARHEGPYRAMAITLECGHLKLVPQLDAAMGHGSYAACYLCGSLGRMVCKIEETGTLHEDWVTAHR